ncbi:MAG: hypothetical protein IT372_23330 [Polyangiaceae bacterium]|nr:hypothetical protein [Polyangiaceae bacterium]
MFASSIGCVADDVLEDEDVESASSELLGLVSFHGGACTSSEKDFLLDSAARGRVIASSSAFEACIRAVMANATPLPNDPHLGRAVPDLEGPYYPCNGDPTSADPASAVVALTRSSLGVAISCEATSSSGYDAYASITTTPGANETMTYIQTSLQASMASSDQNYVAATIWHEAMHQHGYDHGDGRAEDCGYEADDFSDNDGMWMFRHTVPYLVTACMTYLGDISDACRASLSCGPDEVAIRSAFSINAPCVCARDPGWHPVGGSAVMNRVAVARDNAGALEVVGISPSLLGGTMYVSTQTSPNGKFGGWSWLHGDNFTHLDVGLNQDGRLEAFAVSNGTLYHAWQNQSRVWGSWQSLGRTDVQQVAVASSPGGVLNAFVLTTAGSVFRTSQLGPNAAWSGQWEPLDGTGLTAIRVGNNQDGRPEVFAIGGDKSLYHQWQWGGTTTWSGWASLGRNDVDQVTLANESTGALTAYVRAGGAIFATSQSGPNGGWDGVWTPLWGAGLRDVSAVRGSDGHVRVFAVGGDHQAYMTVESSPMVFGPWTLVQQSSTYDMLAVGIDQAGRTNIIGLGTNGIVSQVAVP